MMELGPLPGCVCGGNIEPGSPATQVPAKCCTTGRSLGAGQAQLRFPAVCRGLVVSHFLLKWDMRLPGQFAACGRKGGGVAVPRRGAPQEGRWFSVSLAGPGARAVRELPGGTGPVAPLLWSEAVFPGERLEKAVDRAASLVLLTMACPSRSSRACTHAASGTFSRHRVVLPSQMCGTQAKGFLLAQMLDPMGA